MSNTSVKNANLVCLIWSSVLFWLRCSNRLSASAENPKYEGTRLYFYSKTKQMHQFSQIYFNFVVLLYIFRTVFLSIIRNLRLYIQHQLYVKQVSWLLASGNEFHTVPASKQSAESLWHIPDAVCTVLDSWWWTERPSETYRVLLQIKINLTKLVHLVRFTIEIYHDTRPYKHQI